MPGRFRKAHTVGFDWENSVLIFCSITVADNLAIGLYNAPALDEAVSSEKKN